MKFMFKRSSLYVSKPIVFLILGAICTAIGPFFVEFSSVDAVANTFYRLLIGGVFFFVFSICKNKLILSGQSFLLCLIASVVLVLDLAAWNQGILAIGPGLSTLLGNLEVVFLAFIGWALFKEKYSTLFFKMIFLIGIGVAMLIFPYFFSTSAKTIWGIGLAISSSFFYSIYLTVLKEISWKDPKLTPIAMLNWICLLGAFFIGLFIYSNPHLTFSIPSAKSACFILINALLSQILGWWFITVGIKYLKLSISGVILLLQPALTFMLDAVLFGKNTQLIQIIGCFVILAAVAATIRFEKKI
jgi:drug/metabolite transporter (DMT)-like permease